MVDVVARDRAGICLPASRRGSLKSNIEDREVREGGVRYLAGTLLFKSRSREQTAC